MSVVFREESCTLLDLCHVSLAEAQVLKRTRGSPVQPLMYASKEDGKLKHTETSPKVSSG